VAEVIHHLDADLVIELQMRRPDLFFIHAAVLGRGRGAHLLAGPSGAGKSTTCWGLLQRRGFTYLSDELAPIDLERGVVLPFPRALHLKRMPAGAQVPDGALRTSAGFRVPSERLPCPSESAELPIRSVFFLQYERALRPPSIEPIGSGECAALLYQQSLNALMHPNAGLGVVARVASALRAFRVKAGDLAQTCEAIQRQVDAGSGEPGS